MNKENWKYLSIGDCATVMGGGTPSTKNPEYWDGDISWISPKDLSNNTNKYVSRGERFITKKGLENSSAKILPENSLLFSSRAPIGYLAINKQGEHGAYAVHPWFNYALHQGGKNMLIDSSSFIQK